MRHAKQIPSVLNSLSFPYKIHHRKPRVYKQHTGTCLLLQSVIDQSDVIMPFEQTPGQI